jgi:hypothetical protein
LRALDGLARALQRAWQLEAPTMTLRCIFHVSPAGTTAQAKPERERMPSMLDIDIDFVDDPQPRGRSFETWTRARGWASED